MAAKLVLYLGNGIFFIFAAPCAVKSPVVFIEKIKRLAVGLSTNDSRLTTND